MDLPDTVNRFGLTFSLLLVVVLLTSVVYYPNLLITIYGPVSYVFVTSLICIILASLYEPFRDSWLWRVLFGVMVLSWGLHNIIGPRTALITGYGFVLIGALSLFVGIYNQIAPPTWPTLEYTEMNSSD